MWSSSGCNAGKAQRGLMNRLIRTHCCDEYSGLLQSVSKVATHCEWMSRRVSTVATESRPGLAVGDWTAIAVCWDIIKRCSNDRGEERPLVNNEEED